MIDWNVLLQALVTSGAMATAVGVVFKKYTEKSIEHIFDRKMKEYEAKLREATELRIGIGKSRIEEYKKLSSLVQSVRKQAVDLCAKPDPALDEISGLLSKVKDLQDTIYNCSVTLNLDRVYERVHSYKGELAALAKNIENERNLRDKGQTKRAEGGREIVIRSVADIQSESASIVALLADLTSPKEGSRLMFVAQQARSFEPDDHRDLKHPLVAGRDPISMS